MFGFHSANLILSASGTKLNANVMIVVEAGKGFAFHKVNFFAAEFRWAMYVDPVSFNGLGG